MKTFYTERDIEDMHAAGVTEIEIDDDVVLTDLAREKAITLGLHVNRVEKRSGRPEAMPRMAVAPQMQLFPAVTSSSISTPKPAATSAAAASQSSAISNDELVSRVKSAVIARLGTTEYNGLLDKVIPQVIARLNAQTTSTDSFAQSTSSY